MAGVENRKIVSVTDKQGFKGISKQQGTYRAIYDSLKLSASSAPVVYTFFQDVRTRKFPFTNLTENKLQVQEAISFQRMSLSILECTQNTSNVEAQVPLAYFPSYQRLWRGDMNFQIAQDVVLKNHPMHIEYAPFNHKSKFASITDFIDETDQKLFEITHDVMHLETPLIIPPQIEFQAQIQWSNVAMESSTSDFYICMTLEGLGSLYAPKTNY